MDTWLIDYNPPRAALLSQQGIIIEECGKQRVVHPKISTVYPEAPDLILVLTKSYSTPQLNISPNAPVLTLQNGLGNAEILEAHCGNRRVLAGVTSEAVTWVAPGHIRYTARGQTTFGSWKGCPAGKAFDILKQAGFETTLTDTPERVLWWKATISAAINPLSALLNVPNGGLLSTSESRAILRGLVEEAVATARLEGHDLGNNMVETVEQICDTTGENVSSMLQDIRNKKRTEIESISGEILRRAGAQGLHTPKTGVIYRLVRALERL